MSNQTTTDFISLPTANSSRLIDFRDADVRPGIVANTWFLVVSGEAPCANMEVSLVPLVYVQQPDYWGIEVTGTLPGGICLTAMKPYMVTLDITHVLGTIGIEVIGAQRTERIDVPPRKRDRDER